MKTVVTYLLIMLFGMPAFADIPKPPGDFVGECTLSDSSFYDSSYENRETVEFQLDGTDEEYKSRDFERGDHKYTLTLSYRYLDEIGYVASIRLYNAIQWAPSVHPISLYNDLEKPKVGSKLELGFMSEVVGRIYCEGEIVKNKSPYQECFDRCEMTEEGQENPFTYCHSHCGGW